MKTRKTGKLPRRNGKANLPEKSNPLQTVLRRISAFHSEFGRSLGTAKSVFRPSIDPRNPAQQSQPERFRQFCHTADEFAECPDLPRILLLPIFADFRSPRPLKALLDSPAPFLYGPERIRVAAGIQTSPRPRFFPPLARLPETPRNSSNV